MKLFDMFPITEFIYYIEERGTHRLQHETFDMFPITELIYYIEEKGTHHLRHETV